MSRARLISALALCVSAALLLAACGGDDSSEVPIVVPTETTTSTTGGDLTKDGVHRGGRRALRRGEQPRSASSSSNGEGFTASADIADIRAALLADIEDLGVPTDEDDQATLDEFLAGLQGQVDAGEKIGLALERSEDTATFETELETAKGEASTAASTYGFTECGSDAAAADPTTAAADGATSDTGARSRRPSRSPRRPSRPTPAAAASRTPATPATPAAPAAGSRPGGGVFFTPDIRPASPRASPCGDTGLRRGRRAGSGD